MELLDTESKLNCYEELIAFKIYSTFLPIIISVQNPLGLLQ